MLVYLSLLGGFHFKCKLPKLEINVKFMGPHGPLTSFYSPEQDDICTVPYNQIICTTDSPYASRSGRIYKLSRLSLKTIEQNSTV